MYGVIKKSQIAKAVLRRKYLETLCSLISNYITKLQYGTIIKHFGTGIKTTKKARTYSGVKTMSSINVTGKAEQSHVKE